MCFYSCKSGEMGERNNGIMHTCILLTNSQGDISRRTASHEYFGRKKKCGLSLALT